MQTIIVDCAGIQTTDEFWQCYLDATRPQDAALFGRNLDAFWDAVERGGPGWPGQIKLVFANSSALSHLTNRGGTKQFLAILRDFASRVTAIKIELT